MEKAVLIARGSRHIKHNSGRDLVAAELRTRGHSLETGSRSVGYDFLVDGIIRLCVRIADPGRQHHVVRTGGRCYQYDHYQCWNFNFHRHGHFNPIYCDFFVCVARQRIRVVGGDEFYVIPVNDISGATFSMIGRGNSYGGRYAKYRDAWHLLKSETS